MPIQYYIQENQLTDPISYRGKVDEASSIGLDEIIRKILNRGSSVTKSDITAVLIDLIEIIHEALLSGIRVNIEGLVQLYPTIEGVFNDNLDSFDLLRHKLNITSQTVTQLKDRLRTEATMEKVSTPTKIPKILQVVDTNPGNTNSTLTKNKMINVIGERLKFDSSRAEEGLFFINDTASAEIKQPTADINTATDGKIIFIPITAGSAGDLCHLDVRTRMGNSTNYPLRIASSVSLILQ